MKIDLKFNGGDIVTPKSGLHNAGEKGYIFFCKMTNHFCGIKPFIEYNVIWLEQPINYPLNWTYKEDDLILIQKVEEREDKV